jgi:hypothetical protein
MFVAQVFVDGEVVTETHLGSVLESQETQWWSCFFEVWMLQPSNEHLRQFGLEAAQSLEFWTVDEQPRSKMLSDSLKIETQVSSPTRSQSFSSKVFSSHVSPRHCLQTNRFFIGYVMLLQWSPWQTRQLASTVSFLAQVEEVATAVSQSRLVSPLLFKPT